MKTCLTGMHRSGTSLFARYLQSAGFNLGENLRGPRKGNVLGHYENIDFQNINRKLLKANISHKFFPWKTNSTPLKVQIEAKSLFNEKLPENFLWKDPRSSLFLNFWNNCTPDLRFIFMLREPDAVFDSLIRRSTDKPIKILPFLAYYSWYKYNSHILDFYLNNEHKCVIIQIDDVIKYGNPPIRKLSGFLERELPDVRQTIKQDLFSLHQNNPKDNSISDPLGFRKKSLELYETISSLILKN